MILVILVRRNRACARHIIVTSSPEKGLPFELIEMCLQIDLAYILARFIQLCLLSVLHILCPALLNLLVVPEPSCAPVLSRVPIL